MEKPIIILASSSKGRKDILSSLKVSFKVIVSNVDEEKIQDKNPGILALKRARAKGEAVEKNLPKKGNFLIISADSIAVYQNRILGKPKNNIEARKFLTLLSGKTHKLITGSWVKKTKSNKTYENINENLVTFKKLTSREIETYLKLDDLTKYAGAYGIQNSPQTLITKIEGSISGVIGLPLEFIIPIIFPK